MAEDFMEKIYKERNEKAAKGRDYLLSLIPDLKTANVDRVVAHYDGSGDSGSFEDAKAFAVGEEDDAEPSITLSAVVNCEEMNNALYDILEKAHGGWEIDDGSFGDVVLSVTHGTITLKHNERYSDSRYSEEEV